MIDQSSPSPGSQVYAHVLEGQTPRAQSGWGGCSNQHHTEAEYYRHREEGIFTEWILESYEDMLSDFVSVTSRVRNSFSVLSGRGCSLSTGRTGSAMWAPLSAELSGGAESCLGSSWISA